MFKRLSKSVFIFSILALLLSGCYFRSEKPLISGWEKVTLTQLLGAENAVFKMMGGSEYLFAKTVRRFTDVILINKTEQNGEWLFDGDSAYQVADLDIFSSGLDDYRFGDERLTLYFTFKLNHSARFQYHALLHMKDMVILVESGEQPVDVSSQADLIASVNNALNRGEFNVYNRLDDGQARKERFLLDVALRQNKSDS